MKTYKITSQEFGRGPKSRESFATLAEAQEYIRARWQGAEYIDSESGFHTDYSTYELAGFTLRDIGTLGFDEDFLCRTFTFNSDKPKPVCSSADARRCRIDDCDGAHCQMCGGHFADFHQTQWKVCDSCAIEHDHGTGERVEQGTAPHAVFVHESEMRQPMTLRDLENEALSEYQGGCRSRF